MSNQRICYREAQIRPAHAEARRLGAPLGRRWGHGMPCPDLQPETGASRATARRRRWGAVEASLGARHAVPRPAAGNRRFTRHSEAAPLGHGMPCPDLQPETGASRDTAGPDYSRQTFIRADPSHPC
ncbi:MAG: hypothetical protein K6T87_10870 [Roseiflexus sp.]|uniref:hypothetical protein n=1 Tax=Roseiflexus sp. TaxID=2562120 RepID=UPI0025E822F3|nr:hypothetical protein [Roseiflexus sp.]MCL6541062.1 hypothetical protein [Roseiflexus sp.]